MTIMHFNKSLFVQMIAALTALFLVYHYAENYEENYLKKDESRNLLMEDGLMEDNDPVIDLLCMEFGGNGQGALDEVEPDHKPAQADAEEKKPSTECMRMDDKKSANANPEIPKPLSAWLRIDDKRQAEGDTQDGVKKRKSTEDIHWMEDTMWLREKMKNANSEIARIEVFKQIKWIKFYDKQGFIIERKHYDTEREKKAMIEVLQKSSDWTDVNGEQGHIHKFKKAD